MSADAIDQVLRLVAEGRLSPDEAGPILEALESESEQATGDEAPTGDGGVPRSETGRASAVRVQVMERGASVVNVRVPLALGRMAIAGMPGISESNAARIREAIAEGMRGPILEVLDEGDGVRITLE